jgi:hypothetical protein
MSGAARRDRCEGYPNIHCRRSVGHGSDRIAALIRQPHGAAETTRPLPATAALSPPAVTSPAPPAAPRSRAPTSPPGLAALDVVPDWQQGACLILIDLDGTQIK